MALVEVEGCVFDEAQLALSHGHDALDPVAREAFVNHIHLDSSDHAAVADRIIRGWTAQMRAGWPGQVFRIHRQAEADETAIRFHAVRPEHPNWCEEGIEILIVGEA
ncbi:MAG: hypothetical protein K2W96_15750 [Gemmataceae bacterium]|nr:hypothetical protein [Gemmataceae bacterium]